MSKESKRKLDNTSFDENMESSQAARPMRRRNSLPSIESLSDAPQITNLNNLVTTIISTQPVLSKILPDITTLLQPFITAAIMTATTAAMEKYVSPSLEKIDTKLSNIITEISSMNVNISSNAKRIDELELELRKSDDHRKNQKKIFNAEIERLEDRCDELEQYSRRASLRFSGVNIINNENTDDYIRRVARENLGIELKDGDIDRSHFTGQSKKQIIVKFTCYRKREAIFRARTKLKNASERIFISEDLTRKRHGVIQSLIPLKKSGTINNFWTHDGKIFVKKEENARPKIIKNCDDIS